ncbi:MAG: biopolymer transporter ExbD [Cytophagales bacterium]|nr:biopolymer transporter ExbD [Cytophagales bacterium]
MSMRLGTDPDASDDGLMTEMNTTPLIDVMLVLLVMLIITIPIQLHSVNMNFSQSPANAPKTKPQIIKIDINASNQIVWNAEVLADKAALQVKLDELARASASNAEQPEIHIKPSDSAKYDNVAAVLAAAQRSGFKKIGIVSLTP